MYCDAVDCCDVVVVGVVVLKKRERLVFLNSVDEPIICKHWVGQSYRLFKAEYFECSKSRKDWETFREGSISGRTPIGLYTKMDLAFDYLD